MKKVEEYLERRRFELKTEIASEALGGNEFKLRVAMARLSELTAIECEMLNLETTETVIKEGK